MLRNLDQTEDQNLLHAITVLTSTIQTDEQKVESEIFIIKGILIDESATLHRVEKQTSSSTGWMITTRWITSRGIVNILERHWNDVTTTINELDDYNQGLHASLPHIGHLTKGQLSTLDAIDKHLTVPTKTDITTTYDKWAVTAKAHFCQMKYVQKRQPSDESYTFSWTDKKYSKYFDNRPHRYRWVDRAVSFC